MSNGAGSSTSGLAQIFRRSLLKFTGIILQIGTSRRTERGNNEDPQQPLLSSQDTDSIPSHSLPPPPPPPSPVDSEPNTACEGTWSTQSLRTASDGDPRNLRTRSPDDARPSPAPQEPDEAPLGRARQSSCACVARRSSPNVENVQRSNESGPALQFPENPLPEHHQPNRNRQSIEPINLVSGMDLERDLVPYGFDDGSPRRERRCRIIGDHVADMRSLLSPEQQLEAEERRAFAWVNMGMEPLDGHSGGGDGAALQHNDDEQWVVNDALQHLGDAQWAANDALQHNGHAQWAVNHALQRLRQATERLSGVAARRAEQRHTNYVRSLRNLGATVLLGVLLSYMLLSALVVGLLHVSPAEEPLLTHRT